MMKVYLGSLILFFLSFLNTFSQRQAFNIFWYYNGITFQNFCNQELNFVKINLPKYNLQFDTTVFLGNDTIKYNLLFIKFENYSTISDVYGKFLFHTDGLRVYNQKFEVMDNGDSLFWLSFKQMSSPLYQQVTFNVANIYVKPIIVPFPNNSTMYYLFTTTCTYGNPSIFPPFVSYSIIDMKENYGLGKVLEKRKFLSDNNFFYIDFLPILHKNGKDVWLLTLDKDGRIHNFLITENGIKSGEIINNYKFVNFFSTFNRYFWDFWLSSPNGEVVAVRTPHGNEKTFVIFKFDRQNGKIYQPVLIAPELLRANYYQLKIQFSPDSKKIYLAELSPRKFMDSTFYIVIKQFDIEKWDSATINSSMKIVYIDSVIVPIALPELFFLPGVDGKIYCYLMSDKKGYPDFLITLENPNELPTSNQFSVRKNDTLFKDKSAIRDLSLYSWIFHSFLHRLIDYRKPACEGGELRFYFTPFFPKEILNESGVEFEWSGPAGFYSTDTLPAIPNVRRENFGWYRVKIKTPTEVLTDSVYVFIEKELKIGIEKSDDIMEGDSVRLYLDKRYSKIEWFDGTSDTTVMVRQTGSYWVCVVDTFCCRRCDTVYVKFGKPEEVTIVSLPDTNGVIGDANFCIPLVARKTIGRRLEGIRYRGEIRFDARAFAPKANYNSRIENGECVVEVEGEISDWEREVIELGRICGTVLMSGKKRVPLKISRFEMISEDRLFEPKREDGSLQVAGVCQPELLEIENVPEIEIREIRQTGGGSYEIIVNATTKVDIRLRVYNILGEEIISKNGIHLVEGTNEISLTTKLPKGIYLIAIVSNAGNRKISKFVVAE